MQSSPNKDINILWTETSNYKNIQYDTYKNKDVLSTIRKQHEDKHTRHLISHGPAVQSKLPKNIFNFTIRYMNNTLPTLTTPDLVQLKTSVYVSEFTIGFESNLLANAKRQRKNIRSS